MLDAQSYLAGHGGRRGPEVGVVKSRLGHPAGRERLSQGPSPPAWGKLPSAMPTQVWPSVWDPRPRRTLTLQQSRPPPRPGQPGLQAEKSGIQCFPPWAPEGKGQRQTSYAPSAPIILIRADQSPSPRRAQGGRAHPMDPWISHRSPPPPTHPHSHQTETHWGVLGQLCKRPQNRGNCPTLIPALLTAAP